MLERSDALVQVLAEGNERIFAEVPGSEHVFLAVVLGVEFLFGHDFDVAPVPNVHGGLLVFVLVLVFGGTGVFCGGIVGLRSISGLCCVRSGSCRFCGFADFVLPFGEAEENDAAVESPLRLVKRNRASGRRKFCVGGRIIDGSRFGGLAEIGPSEGDLRGAFVVIVGFGAEDGQVGAFLAPGKAGVYGGGGVENADGASVHVEDLDTVAGFVFGVDGHRQERAGFGHILPSVFGDVTERSVTAGRKLAKKQRGAGGSVVHFGGVRGILFVGILFFGRGAAHGEPGTVRAEGKRLDAVDGGQIAGGEIQDTDFLGDGLFLFL